MLIEGSIEINYIGCGEINASDRIVNGYKAKHNSIPWQVALVLKGKQKPFCGGTIICSKFIMTAAHCIKIHKTKNPRDIQVVAGEHNLEDNSGHEQRRDIRRIALHPNYDTSVSPKWDYDFAIIELFEAIKLTGDSKARAACLPDPTTDINFGPGTNFVISGWGRLQHDRKWIMEDGRWRLKIWEPRELQHATVQAVSDATCRQKLQGQATITESMHCVGDVQNNGVGTCMGDSGG